MKMPTTYSQYEEPKYFNNYLKKTNLNTNVGAFRTQKLDQYTLENLAKFMTYSIYSIWDSVEQDLYYPQKGLISYFQQSNINVNFEHFQDFCEKILGATETSFSLCLCALKLIDLFVLETVTLQVQMVLNTEFLLLLISLLTNFSLNVL